MPKSFTEQLVEHLENATPEQLEENWKILEKYNNVGPTIEEYFDYLKEIGVYNNEKDY